MDTYPSGTEESTTGGHQDAYPAEFRRRMIELVRSGRDPEELAWECEPSTQTIRNRITQADLDEDRRKDGLTTEERQELRRLRRENRRLVEPV